MACIIVRRTKCTSCPTGGMSEDVRGLVGQNIKGLRLAAGLSQAQLAERMGVDRGYISGLEQGARNPTILTLWHVAQALSVKVGAFLRSRARPSGPSRGPGKRYCEPGVATTGNAAPRDPARRRKLF